MGGRGPAPKPQHLRRRANRKAGATTLDAPDKPKIPKLTNPDRRKWHKLTEKWWKNVWRSPMSTQYLETDVDGLARIAILIDDYHKNPSNYALLTELRLQEARFGLSPLDRSRMDWEIGRTGQAESKKKKPAPARPKRTTSDPRRVLKAVK